MRFPPSFIERLREQALMSDIIGRRIALKQFGREYKACCPFHQEKTPSFTINNDKGFFHCFGCGAHGDAIEFIRRYERISYPETIERLARELGIALPEFSPAEAKKAAQEKTLYDVLEAAGLWFEQQLAASSGGGAREYLEKRGLKAETLRQFRLGFAPNEPRLLFQCLERTGFSEALQLEAGLISKRDDGHVFDRFRGRVIFPIRSSKGKVVAFGGRLMQAGANSNLPKYLNSPETPLFKKGEMLFNLDLAKSPARQHNMAVVMEGYMDVIAAYQAGIPYSVATLGTAVTPDHLRLLWQIAKEPVICLDGDDAGKRAMRKAIDIGLPLLSPGLSLRFAVLPTGEDPDSYISRHGKKGFEQILASSGRLSQTIWDTLKGKFALELPEGRAALEDTLRQLCEKITNPTVRQHYLSYFKSRLWEKSAGSKRTSAQPRSAQVAQMAVQDPAAVQDKLVQSMFQLILKFPKLIYTGNREEIVARLEIRDMRLQALRNALLSSVGHAVMEGEDAFFAHLTSQIPDEVLAPLQENNRKLPYRDVTVEEVAVQLWDETVQAYNIVHLKYELVELQKNLGAAMDEPGLKRMVELQNAIKKAQETRHIPVQEADFV